MTATLIMMIAANYVFPSYFHDDQRAIASKIIRAADNLGEDPYLLVAIAWTESRLQHGKVSHTGDHGIFQINWRFWGRRLGYRTVRRFSRALRSVPMSTRYANKVLEEMRKYKTCAGRFLPACYNGGPAWQRSKNRSSIIRYANKVNFLSSSLRRRFPRWQQR